MSRLQIDQITSGMILSEAVKSKAGRLLMAEGMELTEKHLTILRTWGIQEVAIATENEEPQDESALNSAEITTEQLEKALDEVRPIFSQVDLNHPVFKILLRLAAQRKVLDNG